ncbi:MAG: 50S ribosomal protein L9 [Endomicrobium sp.]|jgi:large subunit ribosomal protein L9|nr:50S ribosomal protein L9 [Endomicrobium sp.]
MRIILEKDIPRIGKCGEIIDVANGYARNYLIPKKLALEANKGNIKKLEYDKRNKERELEEEIIKAAEEKQKLDGMEIVARVKVGEKGKIYGEVSGIEIAKLIQDKGYKIEKRDIIIKEKIRKIGDYKIKVRIRRKLEANVKLKVIEK